MTRYRIAYGPKQRDDLIEAEEYHTDAGWYSFVDADDREIMRIRPNDVQKHRPRISQAGAGCRLTAAEQTRSEAPSGGGRDGRCPGPAPRQGPRTSRLTGHLLLASTSRDPGLRNGRRPARAGPGSLAGEHFGPCSAGYGRAGRCVTAGRRSVHRSEGHRTLGSGPDEAALQDLRISRQADLGSATLVADHRKFPRADHRNSPLVNPGWA